MKTFGIIMSALGALFLGYFGLIGIDTGIDGVRTTNIAGLFVGGSLLTSGSVFAAAGKLVEKMIFLNEQPRLVVSNQPKPAAAQNLKKNNVIKRPATPKRPQKEGEQVFIESYKDTPIHQRYNGHYVGEKWFAGLKQARAFIDDVQTKE